MGCTSAWVLNIHAEVLKESAIAGIQWSPGRGGWTGAFCNRSFTP
jgi:hypothetical protein